MAHDDDKRLSDRSATQDFEAAKATRQEAQRGPGFDVRTEAAKSLEEMTKRGRPTMEHRPSFGSAMRRAGDVLGRHADAQAQQVQRVYDRNRTSFSMEDLERFR